MVKVPVTPDADGFVTVNHGLDSEEVVVTCLRADDSPVGYYAAVSVSADEVEVSTVPGSGVVTVVVERPAGTGA